MIRYALKEEKIEFQQMWKETFAFDDAGFTDFFFKEYYDDGKHYVLYEEELISIISRFKSAYRFNGKMIGASMLVGAITKERYRKQGKMKALLNEVLNQCARQELVTFVQAYDPSIYRSFGFEVIYYRSLYHFKKDQFRWILKREVTNDPSAIDLLKAYANFTQHFDGYKCRDLNYFEKLKRQIAYEGGYISAIYRNERICGYIIYYILNQKVMIDECIYLDFKALCALLTHALSLKEEVDLYVSGNEKLFHFFKDVPYEIQDYTMARINHYPLFNALYQSDVSDVFEAFSLGEKPLYLRENL